MDLQKWVQSEVDKHGSANRFAAILGVARQAVSDWLSGKKLLKDRSIEAIAQYMGKTSMMRLCIDSYLWFSIHQNGR
jgi:predicted transcriptional regulator